MRKYRLRMQECSPGSEREIDNAIRGDLLLIVWLDGVGLG